MLTETAVTGEVSPGAGTVSAMPANQSRRAEAAWTAARRMIARKERPCYRVAETGDGTYHLIELPWVAPVTASRADALDRARDAVAALLDVDPDAFDIEPG